MKAQSLPINKSIAVALFVIVLVGIFFIYFTAVRASGGINDLKLRGLGGTIDKQLDDLENYYNLFKKTEGGIDSYEASVLIAKAIEYTWRDCSGACREPQDIADFTNFFATHPITLSRQVECIEDGGTEYKYEDGNTGIYKSRINGICSRDVLETDKTGTVDEWTVTMWGLLKNSVMCTKLRADGEQWGNYECGGGDSVRSDLKCNPNCGSGKDTSHEITQDRIKNWEGGMNVGKSYRNIKVTYDPDCTYIAGKIPLLSGLLGLKQACMEIQISEEANECKTTDKPPKEFSSGECFGNTVNTFYCDNGVIEGCGKNKDTNNNVDASLCESNKGCK